VWPSKWQEGAPTNDLGSPSRENEKVQIFREAPVMPEVETDMNRRFTGKKPATSPGMAAIEIDP